MDGEPMTEILLRPQNIQQRQIHQTERNRDDDMTDRRACQRNRSPRELEPRNRGKDSFDPDTPFTQ